MSIVALSKIAGKLDVARYVKDMNKDARYSLFHKWEDMANSAFFYRKENVKDLQARGDTLGIILDTVNYQELGSCTQFDTKRAGMTYSAFQKLVGDHPLPFNRRIKPQLTSLFKSQHSLGATILVDLLNQPAGGTLTYKRSALLEVSSVKLQLDEHHLKMPLQKKRFDRKFIENLPEGITSPQRGVIDIPVIGYQITLEVTFVETSDFFDPEKLKTSPLMDLKDNIEEEAENLLKGKTVVLTGKTPMGSKLDFAAIIKEEGAIVEPSFTSRTQVVIYNKKQMNTAKLKKAIAAGLKVYPYDLFLTN